MNADHPLPSTWVKCTLDDLAEYGLPEKAEPYEIASDAWVLELEDIEKDTSKLLLRVTFAERQPKSTKNRFASGDVLYGKLRPYLNKVLIADQDGYCTTEIVPVRPRSGVLAEFLFYGLKRPSFLRYAVAASHGLSMPRLGTKAGKEAPFVLAPLNEQKQIVEKLDSLLSKVNECRAQLDLVPPALTRFRRAVVSAATSGRLTEDWRVVQGTGSGYRRFRKVDDHSFRDYKIPNSWEVDALGSIASIVGGVTKDSKKQLSEYVELPYLRVANVQRGYLDLADVRTIRIPEEKVSDLLLRPGDILFNEGGDIDKLGRGWVWEGQIEPCTFQNHVFRARLKNHEFSPKFFSWFGNSRGYDFFLSHGKQSTNLASINKRVLSMLPVPIPPADEQREVERRVAILLEYADRVEARYQAAVGDLNTVAPALLEKAFSGELVPQDPADEPARLLLERMRASRQKTSELRVAGTRKKKTTMPKLTAASVREIIQKWPGDKFGFDDLRGKLPGDYESLREIIFNLLSEADPSVAQVFDRELEEICFRVVRR